MVYNSLVYNFYKQCKKEGKTVIGLCFLNTKSFLNNLCDHIIEINDIEFINTNASEEDNTLYSNNHINNVVPQSSYYGNDGWDLSYIRGQHCIEYEKILLEINFSNIFYTLHVDGSRYINLHGCNNGYIYKINNEHTIFNNINNNTCFDNMYICEKENKHQNSRKIVICIRNTNKWLERNMPSYIYNSVFSYCIQNKILCYVFQDLIPIILPENEYIIDSTDRYKNRPNFDKYLDICNKCDYYIGANSGMTEFMIAYSSTNIKYTCSISHHLLNKNVSLLNLNNLY